MRKLQKLSAFLLALVLALGTCATAYARDLPQVDRTDCSITVTVKYDGKAVAGGKLTCIRVGEVLEEDGNYYFSRLFEPEKLEKIDTQAAAKALEDFYKENKDVYPFETETKTVNKQGVAKFENLPTGLYLIRQTEAAPGYSRLAPFLVSVPYMEDGEYEYDVDAKVKSEVEKIPETKPPKPTKPSGNLPQTGQLNWPVPVLAVLGLALAVVGWMLTSEKRKSPEE